MIIKTYEDGNDLIVVFKGINAETAQASMLKSIILAATESEPVSIENLSPAPPENDEKPNLEQFEVASKEKEEIEVPSEVSDDENQITETVLVTDDNSDVVEEDVPNTLVYDDVSFYEAVNKYAKDNKSVNLNSILMYKPVSKNNRIRLKGLGVEQLKKLICACSPLCKEAARKFIKQKGFEDYSSFLSACPSEFEIKNLTIRCMNAVDKYVETNIANNPKQA